MIDSAVRKSLGFTLLEIQIAILLVAMISLIIVGALRLASQTWEKVVVKQDIAEHQFLLGTMLRKHLSNARFQVVSTDTGTRSHSFFGGANYLHFVAPLPTFENDGELYWWTIKEVERADRANPELVMQFSPFDAAFAVAPDLINSTEFSGGVVTVPIADQSLAFSLSYLGETDSGLLEWSDDWLPALSRPRLVSIDMIARSDRFPHTDLDLRPLTVAFYFSGAQLSSTQ